QFALELGRNRDPARERIAVGPQRHRRRSVKRRGEDRAKRGPNAADTDHTRRREQAHTARSFDISLGIDAVEREPLGSPQLDLKRQLTQWRSLRQLADFIE